MLSKSDDGTVEQPAKAATSSAAPMAEQIEGWVELFSWRFIFHLSEPR
jgi:hypothetical protein